MSDKIFMSDLMLEKLRKFLKAENEKLLDNIIFDSSLYGMSVCKIENLPDDKIFIAKHVKYEEIFKPFIPQYEQEAENSYRFRPSIGAYEEYKTVGMKLEYEGFVGIYEKTNALVVIEVIIRRLYAHFILGVKSSFKPNRFKFLTCTEL